MYRYTFNNGDVVTSALTKDEMLKRMKRLDTLRVLTEGFEEGPGATISAKAWRAYNKLNGFTGIIRLTFTEKDFLSYLLEGEFLSEKDIECINWYIRH